MDEVKAKKSLGQLLHDKRVSKINRAYAMYRLDSNDNTLNDLLQEVIKLGRNKLRPQAAQMGDVGMEDHDDFSQKVAIIVFDKLPEFDRAPQAFYPWLMTIINFHRGHLFDHLETASATKAPLMMQDMEGYEYENPEIYKEAGYDPGAYQPPDGLDGEESLIYDLISDGYTQKRIAEALGVGHSTIERRIRSLKDRFVNETAEREK